MPKKLLLADDSITIQRVIELTFAEEGIDVVAVSDGRQAIEHLDRDPPDIVLADVGMPQVDGYGVASYMKSKPHLARIPVILLAGAFGPIDEARASAAGCDGVLAKPFEPQQAIARVRQLLERGKVAGAADATVASSAAASPTSTTAAASVLDDLPLQMPGSNSASSAGSGSVEDYFERLDQNLTAAASSSPPASESPTAVNVQTPSEKSEPTAATYAGPPPPAEGMTSIAEAFAALLAAEHGAPPPSLQFTLTEEMMETIVARVMERLTRDAVSDVVTKVAERLVREEIEKIKNAR